MTRSTDPRKDDDPAGREDEPGLFTQSDLSGGSGSPLLELDRLRRRLDPEHPDPDHLRRRIQLARRPNPPTGHPAPAEPDLTTLSPTTAPRALTEDRRRRRAVGGTPALVAAVAVLVVLLVGAVVVIRGPLGDRWLGVAGTPTSLASPTQPATDPPSPAPAGFRDCSLSLGAAAYCAEPAECWAGIIGIGDQPFRGTPVDCRRSHVYQTFAAGLVETPEGRQSQYEKLALVKRLCSPKTLDTALGDASAKRYEIIVLPPEKTAAEQVVRCIAGRGTRTSPLPFQPGR
jgi:hypothetical protein